MAKVKQNTTKVENERRETRSEKNTVEDKLPIVCRRSSSLHPVHRGGTISGFLFCTAMLPARSFARYEWERESCTAGCCLR